VGCVKGKTVVQSGTKKGKKSIGPSRAWNKAQRKWLEEKKRYHTVQDENRITERNREGPGPAKGKAERKGNNETGNQGLSKEKDAHGARKGKN